MLILAFELWSQEPINKSIDRSIDWHPNWIIRYLYAPFNEMALVPGVYWHPIASFVHCVMRKNERTNELLPLKWFRSLSWNQLIKSCYFWNRNKFNSTWYFWLLCKCANNKSIKIDIDWFIIFEQRARGTLVCVSICQTCKSTSHPASRVSLWSN